MNSKIFFKIIIPFIIIISIVYLFFVYYLDTNNEIITIFPDKSPTKIKPAEAGGIVVANSNNIIYENFQSNKKSHTFSILQPEPEKPLNIILNKPQNEEVTDPIDTILNAIIEKEPNQNSVNLSVFDSQDNSNDIIIPNIIQPSIIKIEALNEANTTNEFVSSENLDNKEESVTVEQNQASDSPINRMGLNIVKISQKNNTNKNNNLYQEKLDNQHKGFYRLQLASVKSELEATQEGERIKKKYNKILLNATISVKKVPYDKGKFFYLALAGNYDSLSKAKTICKKLANNQQNCIITN